MTSSALTNQPSNPNALHQFGGRMVLKRAPHLVFFLQEINIPGVRLGTNAQASPLDEMPWPGDRLYREPLSVSFKVDENLKNYLEVLNWMIGLTAPDAYSQYAALSKIPKSQRMAGVGVHSDLTISISNSAYRPNLEFRFQDCYPEALGSMRFTTTDDQVRLVECQVSFKYRHFTVHDPSED